jgi:uncharacterized membrane protein
VDQQPQKTNRKSRLLLGGLFIGAGANHFVMPRTYEKIVPPGIGDPGAVVALSGVAEIAGGVGCCCRAHAVCRAWP